MATRIFLLGAIVLFFGGQLRAIDSFVLSERVTKVVNKQIEKRQKRTEKVQSAVSNAWDSIDQVTPEPELAAMPAPPQHQAT